MQKVLKNILLFIAEISFILIFWVSIITLTVVLFEYLGEKIYFFIHRDKTQVNQEKIIYDVLRVYPEGEFNIKKHGGFETGSLEGWGASGEAFASQPTYEDNPFFRGIPLSTNIAGDYWIGTYEQRPNKESLRGETQGDVLIGTLTSGEFIVTKSKISFLIGGGKGANTRVEFLIDNKIVLYRTGHNSETLRRVYCDVSQYIGQKARLCIVDYSKGHWGHINVDDFRIED